MTMSFLVFTWSSCHISCYCRPISHLNVVLFQYWLPTSAYVRLCTLGFVEWMTDRNNRTKVTVAFAASIINEVICRLDTIQPSNAKHAPFPNTSSYRHQIRLWQSLCCLSSHTDLLAIMAVENTGPFHQLWKFLRTTSHPDIRHLMEIFFCRLSMSSPTLFLPLLRQGLSEFNAPIQQISSFIIIAGCLLLLSQDQTKLSPLDFKTSSIILCNDQIDHLIAALLPHAVSNSALVRGTVHSLFIHLFTPDVT